jgi:formate dehydrogenase iron-sulfur subunit
MTAWAILTDTTLCTGCEKCVAACKLENRLGKDAPRRWKRRIDDLSSTRYITVLRRPGGRFVRRQCRHCLQPACVSACLVGALQRTAEGPVAYDPGRCMGCRYCMVACPYGIPRYDWESPIPHIRKCTMCRRRILEGKMPACVEACGKKATIFGRRDELLQEAHHRIAGGKGKYLDEVFGETEIGGASVLYVSDIPLDFLAFQPKLGDRPLPDLTWAALSKVPSLVVGVGGVMAGVWWVIGRRAKVEKEAAQRTSRSEGAAASSGLEEEDTA